MSLHQKTIAIVASAALLMCGPGMQAWTQTQTAPAATAPAATRASSTGAGTADCGRA